MNGIAVLIVGDDELVANVNAASTESVPGFRAAKIAATGREALAYLETGTVDLIVLDASLPDVIELDFLKTLRKRGYPADFILVVATHDPGAIEESLRFGIFDYLVKPVSAKRYAESLLGYRARREASASSIAEAMDLTDGAQLSPARDATVGAKGINPETMKKVRELVLALDTSFGIDEVSSGLMISRITAHRYLEFMVQTGQLKKEFRYRKVGRPTAVYTLSRRGG